MSMWSFIGLSLLGGGVLYASTKLLERVVVYEFQHGLLFKNGKFSGLVKPGTYWLLRKISSIYILEARPRIVTISGQEILTADAVSIKVSLLLEIEVSDPKIAYLNAADFEQHLYAKAQNALRDLVGNLEIQELLDTRQQISEKLLEHLSSHAESLGVKLSSISIKDVMFPGALKESFSQVARAKQETLANLEKARGESAAMRKLANTSQLLDKNPALYKMKLLQVLSEAKKVSLTLNTPDSEPEQLSSKRPNK